MSILFPDVSIKIITLSGSMVSLAMGLTFGGLSAVGSYQMSQNARNFHLLLGTSALLTIAMGMRVFKSQKFLSPAGVVTGLR